MEMFKPLVSIVIPVYNGSNYLREAIDSALAQTYKDIEVIVVNDGSKDDGATEKIALSYGDKIRYYAKENGGVATALNYGIEKMRGEYFSWLSHDDLYTPQKISNEISILSDQKDKTIIPAGGYQVVDSKVNFMYNVDPLSQYPQQKLNTPLFALLRGCIHGCALLIHRSHFERVGTFRTDLPTTQDYDLFFRMFRGQMIIFYSELNVLSRSHEEQDSKKYIDSHVQECDTLWIGFMDSLTEQEMCQMDGSVLDFYTNLKTFLYNVTGYTGAKKYVDICLCREACKQFTNNKKRLFKYLSAEFNESQLEAFSPKVIEKVITKKDRPRVIFILSERNAGGGLVRVLLKISDALCKYYDISIVSVNELTNEGQTIQGSNINEFFLPWSESYTVALSKFCKLLQADLVVSSFNCSELYLPLYKDIKPYRIKSIAWNHEHYFLPYWNQALLKCLPMRNEMLGKADVVIDICNFSAYCNSRLHDNSVLIHNPLTVEPREICNINRCKDIISVSRFDDPRKGFAELLKTFSIVLKYEPKTKLYLVGPYDLDLIVPEQDENISYAELIKRLRIPSESLIFTGEIKNVEDYYPKACINILTSRYEGFGLVISEAAVFGLPSIVFAGSGFEDIIDDCKNGFIIPVREPALMANRIVELLQDSQKLSDYGKATKDILLKFSPQSIVQKWKSLIDAILSKEQNELKTFLRELSCEGIDEVAYHKKAFQEYEICIKRLSTQLVKEKGENINVQPTKEANVYSQPSMSPQAFSTEDISNLIRETSGLIKNITCIYDNLLVRAQSQQIVKDVASLPQSGKKRIRSYFIRLIRGIFRPLKQIFIKVGLKKYITSTKLYKNLRVRGVIDKLNGYKT